MHMEQLVMNKVTKGDAEQPRSFYDNYKLSLDNNMDEFKRDQTEPYVTKDLLNTLNAKFEEKKKFPQRGSITKSNLILEPPTPN